jgi:hypothetical protein
VQGWTSVTLHLTRRELQTRQACLARTFLALPGSGDAVEGDCGMLDELVNVKLKPSKR